MWQWKEREVEQRAAVLRVLYRGNLEYFVVHFLECLCPGVKEGGRGRKEGGREGRRRGGKEGGREGRRREGRREEGREGGWERRVGGQGREEGRGDSCKTVRHSNNQHSITLVTNCLTTSRRYDLTSSILALLLLPSSPLSSPTVL